MSFAAMALCLSTIAFTVATAVASGATTLLHAACAARLRGLPPHHRASAYLWLRLAPAATGLLAAGLLVLPAYLLYEPRSSGEHVTLAVFAATLLAAIPLVRSGHDTWRAWRSTRARVATWLADAEPLPPRADLACPAYAVRAPFPVVAAVGVRRPFLVVSRAVIEACSDDELTAILAHEATHLRHRDNLKRLLMFGAPDLLARTAIARTLELGWQRAAEEVADDGAGAQRSLDLAAALVKVARLARGLPAPPAAVAAFCRGDDIARRVTRLTLEQPCREESLVRGLAFVGVALAAALSLSMASSVLSRVHVLTELLVTSLQ